MLKTSLESPWKPINEIRRIAALPYIRLMFALHGVKVVSGSRIFGMPVIQRHRGSQILLGPNLELRSWRRSNPLMPNHPAVLATRTRQASIRIGASCALTGATIVASSRIEIGDRVVVGANATIVDTDFHPLNAVARQENMLAGTSLPVHIGNDVFIGMNAILLKGVSVGSGAVIGAGSVVTGDVAAGTVVAGNPARVVRKL